MVAGKFNPGYKCKHIQQVLNLLCYTCDIHTWQEQTYVKLSSNIAMFCSVDQEASGFICCFCPFVYIFIIPR